MDTSRHSPPSISFAGASSLSTWLTRIVLNEALGRRRSAQRKLSQLRAQSVALIDDYRENLMGGSAASSSPEADAARGQIARLLEQAIADLPEAFRIVFMLREVEGLSVEETADALQIAPPDGQDQAPTGAAAAANGSDSRPT